MNELLSQIKQRQIGDDDHDDCSALWLFDITYLGLVHRDEVLVSDEERQVKARDRFPPENFKAIRSLLKKHDVLFRQKLFQVVSLQWE